MSDFDSGEIFSGRRLTTLPKTQFSGLDYDNILSDITQLVNENPDYNNEWEDFLSSNAGRMLTELFAYIADQLATRIDWVVNENFIGTATQRKSIVRLLKLIGYNLSLPTPSVVPVTLIFDRPTGPGGEVLLSYYDYTNNRDDLNIFTLTAKGKDGIDTKNFEAIPFDETTKRFTYKDLSLTLNTGSTNSPNLIHTVKFYEGKTFSETITVDTNNNFVYELAQSPVIENSIEVYILNNGTPENLLRVNSFLDPNAQREADVAGGAIAIPYILNTMENQKVTVEFGPISLLPRQSRRPQVGDRIRIFYRVGGGANGNITRRTINTLKTQNFDTISSGGIVPNSATAKVRFINNSAGTGGSSGESVEYAAAFGPLQIRTAQKAVTAEDYDTLLSAENTILKAKAFGNNNIPANLYSLYGLYIRPLEVWNYIIVDKPGWESVPPSRYKDFNWAELRLENRFNEIHSFVDGFFNQNISALSLNTLVNSEQIEWKTGDTIEAKNFIVLPTSFEDPTGNMYIDSSNFRTRLTSKIVSDNFFDLTNNNNLFSPTYELNSFGTLSGNGGNFQIKQDINAYYVSTQEYISDDYEDRTLRIALDNRDPVDLVIPSPILENYSKEEFVDFVNQSFKEDANYNNDNTPTQASTTVTGVGAGNPSVITISATSGGQFDGTALNRFTFTFIDTGSDVIIASVSGDVVSLNFRGNPSASATAVAAAIEEIDGLSVTVDNDGDNFTADDDVGQTYPEFTGGFDTIKTKGKQRLGMIFENSVTKPKKSIDVADDVAGNYVALNNTTDDLIYWFWFNVNGTGIAPEQTIDEDPSIPTSSLVEVEVPVTLDSSDGIPNVFKLSNAFLNAINNIAGFTATVEDAKITVINDVAGFARKPILEGTFFIVAEEVAGLIEGVSNNQEVSIEVGRTFLNSNSTYSYKINGIQYNFTTGTNPLGPGFEEMRESIEESAKIPVSANFTNQSETFEITVGNDFIHFIKPGMKVRSVVDETAVLDTSEFINFPELSDYTEYRIKSVNWKTNEITFVDNQVANRTADDYEIWIYPYDVEIVDNPDFAEIVINTDTNSNLDGDYIIIKNNEDNVYYYFWFDSTGSVIDPDPIELYLVDPADKTGININTSAAADADAITSLLQAAIDGIGGLSAEIDINQSNLILFQSTDFGMKEKVIDDGSVYIDINYRYKDVEIINPSENPVEPIWIQEAQNVMDSHNIFKMFSNNLLINPYDFDKYSTVSYGAVGSQYLGIDAVINRTRGFQSFPSTDLSSVPGNISFILTIDGVQMNSGGEIVVNLSGVTTLSALILAINTELEGIIEGAGFVSDEVEVIEDEEGLVRFTSTTEGSTSSVDVADGNINGISDLLGVPNNAVQGEDDALVIVSEYDKEYSFVLNNFQYDILIETGDTMIDLFNKINQAIDIHGYTIEIIHTGQNNYQDWVEDFLVTNRAKERVRFEDVDLFSSLGLTKLSLDTYETTYDNSWAGFDNPIGGGDYSSIAKTFRITTDIDISDYFGIFSPSVSQSSVIEFFETGADDANFSFFGLNMLSGSSETCYGYNRATIVSNTANPDYGRVIYEIGSLNFRGQNSKNIFYHFIYNENKKIVLGRYNTDNFETTDPSYRGYARRVYNTVYNENTQRVDFNLSNFRVKFTRDETEQVSLFSIEDDWELQESIPASVSTVEITFKETAQTEIETSFISSSSYLFRVNIDSVGDVEIDITGDQGNSTGYSIEQLIDNINNAIQGNTSYFENENPIYRFFLYAKLNETRDRIIISSPTNSENSMVRFKQPSNPNADATGNFFTFDTSIPGYQYDTFASGDYYFDMNKFEFTGNFEAGTRQITVPKPGPGLKNTLLEDLKERIDSRNLDQESPEGAFLFLEVTNIAVDSFVTLITIGDGDDDDIISISNAAGTSANNQKFFLSDDLIAMYKIPKEEGNSTFPDLEFHLHFINDRRYREDVFDGRILEIGQGQNVEQITTNGFPLLSLDEDVYDTNLNDKKIVGVNHVFKTPKFKTFDISGTVYYRSNYSRVDVQNRVESSLNEYFNLTNRGFGEIVARSTVMNIIHLNDGVEYVEIDYLGPDLTDVTTDVDNVITARFDEIIVLSEFNSIGGVQTSGIKFDYNISKV